MELRELIERHRDEIQRIAAAHGACNIALFGSAARGEAGPDSDVDLLVDTLPNTSAWFPAGLVLDLEALLGRRVEVVTRAGLNPLLRDRVQEEACPL